MRWISPGGGGRLAARGPLARDDIEACEACAVHAGERREPTLLARLAKLPRTELTRDS